jgi:hypothetical protein
MRKFREFMVFMNLYNESALKSHKDLVIAGHGESETVEFYHGRRNLLVHGFHLIAADIKEFDESLTLFDIVWDGKLIMIVKWGDLGPDDSEEAVNAYHEKIALEKSTRTATTTKRRGL